LRLAATWCCSLFRLYPKLYPLREFSASLKHQWLFLHSLDSVTTIRRLVAFDVHEHNHVLPHTAFRGQMPDEMYFGTGDAVPADLRSRAAAARQARVEANRSASCETCPSLNAAA
jgi:putative transposase